jgi:CelD/BcsL family acetyltransferase involved in cellulose biosynthesis
LSENIFDGLLVEMKSIDSGSWQLASSATEFLKLKADWEHLFEQNSRHSPFLAWGWVNAWLRHIAGPHELRIACWRDALGELQFVLPLISRTSGRSSGQRNLALVCSYGPECSDHLGCLRVPAHESKIAEISAVAISRFFDQRHRISLAYLDNAGEYPSRLKSALQANGRTVRQTDDVVCPTVDLAKSWDEHLLKLSRNFRSQIRRHYKRISEHEQVQFRAINETDAESFTYELMQLNRARIREKGEVSSLESESFRNFLAEAVPYMASHGIAWMDVIEDSGNIVGSALNFVHGESVYFYMGGFDEKAKNLRPGTALFALVMMRSISAGYAHYNFLRGAEAYKYRWGAQDILTNRLDIYAHGLIDGRLQWAIDGARFRARKLVRRMRSQHKR